MPYSNIVWALINEIPRQVIQTELALQELEAASLLASRGALEREESQRRDRDSETAAQAFYAKEEAVTALSAAEIQIREGADALAGSRGREEGLGAELRVARLATATLEDRLRAPSRSISLSLSPSFPPSLPPSISPFLSLSLSLRPSLSLSLSLYLSLALSLPLGVRRSADWVKGLEAG